MALDSPTPPDNQPNRRWQRLGLAGVITTAVLLLGATFWVSQGGGSPVSGATGAASPDASESDPAAAPDPTEPPATITPAPSAAPGTDAPAPEESEAPVEVPPLAELPPVPLTEQVAPVPGVVFGIDSLEAVDGVAQGPGEVGGPALRFTLTMRNDTDAEVSLAATVVNLYAGADQLPMVDLREPGGIPLPETVAAGATVTGVFIFAVPTDQRDQVKIGVDYVVGVPIVVFEGSAPR